MIEYLRGELVFRNPAYVVLECAGVGYRVHISLYTYTRLNETGLQKLYIHEQIREDSHTLFGFFDVEERHLFQQLISVSGVGAATSQLLLSSLSPDEIRNALIGEQEAVFSKVKGIGPKTAKRLIVELKDKVMKSSGGAANLSDTVINAPQNNRAAEDALQALLVLGIAKPQAQKALQQALSVDATLAQFVDRWVKAALRLVS